MAVTDFDTLVGELEISARPATLCYGRPWDFVSNLVKILTVKFPVNRNNKFIVSGPETPGTDDTDKLWAKFTRNRSPLGWWAFINGNWRRFYTVVPGEIRWIIGDSSDIPEGWVLVSSSTPGADSEVLTQLLSQFVENGSGGYKYFAIRYIGY